MRLSFLSFYNESRELTVLITVVLNLQLNQNSDRGVVWLYLYVLAQTWSDSYPVFWCQRQIRFEL